MASTMSWRTYISSVKGGRILPNADIVDPLSTGCELWCTYEAATCVRQAPLECMPLDAKGNMRLEFG